MRYQIIYLLVFVSEILRSELFQRISTWTVMTTSTSVVEMTSWLLRHFNYYVMRYAAFGAITSLSIWIATSIFSRKYAYFELVLWKFYSNALEWDKRTLFGLFRHVYRGFTVGNWRFPGSANASSGKLRFQQLNHDIRAGTIQTVYVYPLKAVLVRRFCPPEREMAHRCEFRNRKRKSKESVAEFGYALRRLSSLAYPSLQFHVREGMSLDQYIAGLDNQELRRHVQFAHPQSLDKAISLALEFEAFNATQLGSSKPTDQIYQIGAVRMGQKQDDVRDSQIDQLRKTVEIYRLWYRISLIRGKRK